VFENSLIESAKQNRKASRGISLPLSVAVHAIIVGATIAASLWFVEGEPEPPIPVTFHSPGPPPPFGTTAKGNPRPARSQKSRFIPPTSQPLVTLKTLPSAAREKEEIQPQSPEISEEGGSPGVPGGVRNGIGTFRDGESGPDRNIETPIRVGGDVLPPQLIRRVEPVYPETERKLHKEGVVILEAIITADGGVDDLRILKSADPILDETARRAVLQWRYRPATLSGRAVRVYLTVTMTFSLH
jgi:periplasmic protein TonB